LIAIANAYNGWRAAALSSQSSTSSTRAAQLFIQKNSLSLQNLIQIEEGRSQLLRVLMGAGVVGRDVEVDGNKRYDNENISQLGILELTICFKRLPRPFLTEVPALYSSSNAAPLILATLAAGLYPSLLIHDPPSPTASNVGTFLHPPGSQDIVRVHSRSVLAGEKLIPGWYISHTISKTDGPGVGAGRSGGRITAWDLNRVGSLAVACAGGGGIPDHRTRTLQFDSGRLTVKCLPRTAALISQFLPFARSGIEERMGLDKKGKKSSLSLEKEKAVDILMSILMAEGKNMSLVV
jgi:hypothetical protein